MALVSIVVPIYNVEKYLIRCVDSLRSQTLTDIEIILVDDGSPDNCPVMCDELALEDSRIKVVHKPNGGLSSARNAGINVATGKYIGFVDSDDTVELDMFEKMFNVIEYEKVDFVMSDYLRITDNRDSYIKTLDVREGKYNKNDIENIIFPNLIMRECIDYGPLLSVWHCLYNREFLCKYNLRFDEQVRWSEDNIFSSIMGYYANSFYYMKGEALYHYYQNPGTITTGYRKGAWDVYCRMNDHLHNFFDNIKDYDFSRQLKLHMIYYACNCIGQALRLPKKQSIFEIKEILFSEKLTNAFKDFDLPNIPFKLKLQILLMKHKQVQLLYFFKK